MTDFITKRSATLRIVGIYALVGLAWIYTSDTVLAWLVRDPDTMTHMELNKGSFFIILTSALLYFLISRYSRNLTRSQQALKASEERYRLLAENITDVVWSIDLRTNRFSYVSPSVHTLRGYTPEEVMSQPIEACMTPDSLAKMQLWLKEKHEALRNGDTCLRAPLREIEQTRKDGTTVWTEVSTVYMVDENNIPVEILGVSRDITERKLADEERQLLERQILQAQKLESLGVLAGGIAHDFNNILTAIIGNAELALMRLNPESPVLENLQRIETAAARAADLAKQMLAYSGKGKFIVEAIDLNRLVEEMVHMLEISVSKKVIMRYNLAKPLPTVNVDATQIRQIIMNLVINASEAIGDRSGVIAIATGCTECTENCLSDTWFADRIPDGLYVFVEIADTGCGMDRETMSKIFDPFFTTKFTGRGLGMAAVLGIIRSHKGAIKVSSEPAKGSRFKVLLPAGDKPGEIFNGQTVQDDWKGQGTVLLVDDEETVRVIGSEMLKELGFKVITANDGRDAVEKFSRNPSPDIVILDLVMPHMDGEQCLRELRQLAPDLKVIMSSGFSEHEITEKFAGKGMAGFIQKPYKLSVLRDVIRKATGEYT